MISRPTAVTSDKVPAPILFKLNLSCATKKRLRVKIATNRETRHLDEPPVHGANAGLKG